VSGVLGIWHYFNSPQFELENVVPIFGEAGAALEHENKGKRYRRRADLKHTRNHVRKSGHLGPRQCPNRSETHRTEKNKSLGIRRVASTLLLTLMMRGGKSPLEGTSGSDEFFSTLPTKWA